MKTLTPSQAASALANGETTSLELVNHFLQRVEAHDPAVRAVLGTYPDQAREEARRSDQRRREGKTLSAFDGVPLGIKDNISRKGWKMTSGSKFLESYHAPYSATVVERCLGAGMIPLARLNLDEFAMGSANTNSAFHPTHNPWDTTKVPGGSSGGSAASVAAGLVPWSLGSDTGGSIRQPASFCGAVGLKPTYGRVSRYGLTAFASSLDQIGPLAPAVADAAALYEIIAGHDPHDSTSLPQKLESVTDTLDAKADRALRVGFCPDHLSSGLDPEISRNLQNAVKLLEAQGCEIVEVELPHSELTVPVYYIIATAEASSNLGRFDGIRYTRRSEEANDAIEIFFKSRSEGFGPEVKRRIILGTYVLSSGYYDAYYLKAQKIRTLIREGYQKALSNVDVLIGPTSPETAFPIGERQDDPLAMYLSDLYTIPANLTGLPAISVPSGLHSNGMPIGLQFTGKSLDEAGLFAAARKFERAREPFPGIAPAFA